MQSSQLPVVVRGAGTTPSERYLKRLCDRTFLSLWSYPGLFRDQGNQRGGDGKEVCDLIVVFGDQIILFSDKDCAFPHSGSLQTRWSRWFRKAVLKSAEQVWGAERWIVNYPDRLFVDKACKQRFPLDLPTPERMHCHRIVVAHNVSEPCRKHLGGSGTLMFNSDIEGPMHWDPRLGPSQPFASGWLDRTKGFVHVIDDVGLDILLRNRDTISDFLDYLQAKEELLQREMRVFITGEEELLAHYLTTLKDGKHGFAVPTNIHALALPEGEWEDFERSEERRAQVTADHISYYWDALIETFNQHILGGTSHFVSHTHIGEHEKIMRFLARESRFRRRMLAEALVALIEKATPQQRATRVVLPSFPGDPHFVFLLLPKLDSQSEEDYRLIRREILEACCRVTKVVCPEAEDIVGIATQTDPRLATPSEDALYLNARHWTPETVLLCYKKPEPQKGQQGS